MVHAHGQSKIVGWVFFFYFCSLRLNTVQLSSVYTWRDRSDAQVYGQNQIAGEGAKKYISILLTAKLRKSTTLSCSLLFISWHDMGAL